MTGNPEDKIEDLQPDQDAVDQVRGGGRDGQSSGPGGGPSAPGGGGAPGGSGGTSGSGGSNGVGEPILHGPKEL